MSDWNGKVYDLREQLIGRFYEIMKSIDGNAVRFLTVEELEEDGRTEMPHFVQGLKYGTALCNIIGAKVDFSKTTPDRKHCFELAGISGDEEKFSCTYWPSVPTDELALLIDIMENRYE